MPTGYTADIKNGISFRKFALNCARNFGATIALRDEDSSVLPNPENVKFNSGNSYHEEQLIKAIAEKARLQNLTKDELRTEFLEWRENTFKELEKTISEKRELRQKYEKMYEKVHGWSPPTEEHFNMKDFMLKQIAESIDFDCGEKYCHERIKEVQSTHQADYFWDNMESLERDIEYHSKHRGEDEDRDDKRSQWVKNLIDSLPTE
jgi:hypothetical protein